MAKQEVLGLYGDANYAAEACDALQRVGLTNEDYDFPNRSPIPRGSLRRSETPATACTCSLL